MGLILIAGCDTQLAWSHLGVCNLDRPVVFDFCKDVGASLGFCEGVCG